MTPLLRFVAAVLALVALYQQTLAAEAAKTQVMLLGTYHFSNPGQDLNNVKAVDILTAERQREIGRVEVRSTQCTQSLYRCGTHRRADNRCRTDAGSGA
jgi:hypothetical protein